MDDSAENSSAVTPRRKKTRSLHLLPRFGLRTLFVLGVIFSLFFGYVGRNLYRERNRIQSLETLRSAECYVEEAGFRGDRPDADPDQKAIAESISFRLALALGMASTWEIREVRVDEETEHASAAVRALTAFPELRRLTLEGSIIDDATMTRLDGLPNLEELCLYDTAVTGEGLSRLKHAGRIRSFRYIPPEPTDGRDIFVAIARMRDLRDLHVSDLTMSERDAQRLAAQTSLEDISFNGVDRDEDCSFASFSRLSNLRSLYVDGMQFDDEDLAEFAAMLKLNTLQLHGTNVTDAGLDAAAGWSSLELLDLSPPTTFGSALVFSAKRPQCVIRYFAPDNSIVTAVGGEEVSRTQF